VHRKKKSIFNLGMGYACNLLKLNFSFKQSISPKRKRERREEERTYRVLAY